MPHTGRDKAAKTTCISYEPEDIQQQPDAAPVVKTRGNSAPFQKLPSGQQHADGRSLPPAPITATKKVPQNSQQGPGTSATPLTGPNTLSGSIEPEMSSGASADGNLVSSDDDASSYEPSSRKQASPDTEERGPPVSRPPLHPKTFSKHGHNVVQRKSRASDDAVKPANHHKSLVAPIVQVLPKAVPFLHCNSCHLPGCKFVMYRMYLRLCETFTCQQDLCLSGCAAACC